MIFYELHISKKARIKYNFDNSLFSLHGDLIIADFKSARILTEKINKIRRAESNKLFITTGQLNAAGLIHEILHHVIRAYEEKENPNVFSRGLNYLEQHLGDQELNKVLLKFIQEFPPLEVHKENITEEDYLNSSTNGKSHKEIILEEILLLHLENTNPAALSLEELFSDKNLMAVSKYPETLEGAEQFFILEKPIGPENLPLLQFLRKPILNSPYSIDGQLDYILEHWKPYLNEKFYERILKGKDLIFEDLKLFMQHGGGEKATPPVPTYPIDYFDELRRKLAAGLALTEDESRFYYSETEKFTTDIDWMPKVVMIAKNTFVWLNQLSRKYHRDIRRLDQIPDEELDLLAKWNFTALWLIGIWERSSASKKIKQIMGNPEAASSAYSLYDYVIAGELGGEDAFQNLKGRAWQRGIRVASDMVPNHTGIYSKWVVEKPHYFIQSDYSPYPGYSFTGPNLSDDNRVEIRIEDRYYNKSDAAVIFQRRDSYTGDVKYIYHGNDGTHMPWNDTAQLNLLNPEVRETLIQTIMHVARKTPIIRFDAAMTLAKKHYQRLWFPQPGTGGAIPSRSDFSMTRTAFDEAMPEEFWREVVDRINAELPDTLLLAEAFWLMEGFFVRTLGMHRVYNSAFMHMLMKEENDKYRELIKNTLEFNPEILKRYVNFMSNPDEETAINQFGKGDKYFGVTILMLTLPGLPMFAHGQIEGFSEKYGMEYMRAYYDEYPDQNLIQRHEAEIFPIVGKRYLFSQVHNFEFFDFIDNYGNINENVFAYTNRTDHERTLVIYNNSYNECTGTIKFSLFKGGSFNHGSKKLGEALAMNDQPGHYYICRETRSNLEFIFNGKEMHEYGFFVHLWGYHYKVFLDFKEVYDSNGEYHNLFRFLNGRGIPSIEYALKEQKLLAFHNSFLDLFNRDETDKFITNYFPETKLISRKEPEYFPGKIEHIVDEINHISHVPLDKEKVLEGFKIELKNLKEFSAKLNSHTATKKKSSKKEAEYFIFFNLKRNEKEVFFPLIVLNQLLGNNGINPADFYERFLIDNVLRNIFDRLGLPQEEIKLLSPLVQSLVPLNPHAEKEKDEKTKKKPGPKNKNSIRFEENLVKEYLGRKRVREFIYLNEFQGVKYYNKERFEIYLKWLLLLNLIKNNSTFTLNNSKVVDTLKENNEISGAKVVTKFADILLNTYNLYLDIKSVSDKAGYNFDVLCKQLLNENEKKGGASLKKVSKNKKR